MDELKDDIFYDTKEEKEESNNSIIKNEIRMIIQIEEKDKNKNIYFLDNTDYIDEETKINHFHDNLPELNQSNVELFINNEKNTFQKYFIPNKEGLYSIKLIFKTCIKNCSYMFNECSNILSIDLSSFNTKNVLDMSYMFAYCYKLKTINLFNFDTKNVINMSHMFAYCHNLSDINISFLNTKNVINMNSMFAYCYVLKDLNLSSFDTSKVKDMGYMFSNCENFESLDLSFFNTEKVTDMRYMFSSCYKLKYIDLSSFNIKNITNVNGIFFPCSNLSKIKINEDFYKIVKYQIDPKIQIIII